MTDPKNAPTSRRDFFKTTSAAAAAGAAAMHFIPNAHAAKNDVIKVGVVGCGGRGTGAAENICVAAGTSYNIKLHALGDVFEDRVNNCYDALRGGKLGEKFAVDKERCFHDFDAFKQVTDCCDLVILATPPGFRPQHLAYAVGAGKNVFCEKPVAVDGPGIRKVLEVAKEAKKKNLAVVAGTQRRHQSGYIEAMKRVKDGAIGDLVSGRVFWNQANIWARARKPEWKTDMEAEIRNWYHYTWLCGQCIVEQHVHNLDVACWALGNPVSCVGMGGREVNKGPEFGESFDHFAVDYEFPNGVHVMSMARQINGCQSEVAEHFVGTKGRVHLSPGNYRFEGEGLSRLRVRNEVNPYVQEHIDMLESITSGKPINELEQVAHSCLTAIMGRMSAFTGKTVSWEKALNSRLNTFPDTLEWGKRPEPVIAVPGQTELI